ncbi:MAG: hypothetical protein GY715_19025 [Planctomycetes bacterium]|nr:hypothetical protein [Planctomycetota bacterium]
MRGPTLLILLLAGGLVGCEVDSFFNPSITGYWENQPTTIPILERIDVIEQDDDYWGQTSDVTPEDLIPSDLAYRAVPGDFVTVQIFELFREGEWSTTTRRIDAGGFLRVPKVGELEAAGRTPQEIEDVLSEILSRDYMTRPQVDVVVEDGTAFHYTVYGAIRTPSLYNLIDPDLRLIDALALAGGVGQTIESIYVIRQVGLSEDVKPMFERGRPGAPRDTGGTPAPPPVEPPVDIDELIDQLDDDRPRNEVSPGVLRQDTEPIIDIDDLLDSMPPPADDPVEIVPPPADPRPASNTGARDLPPPPVIDIDELEPARAPGEPEVDIDTVRRAERDDVGTWIYVEERGEWVRVARGAEVPEVVADAVGEAPLFVERIIRIPNDRLQRGDSRYNIVVRPDDRIYVEPPVEGVVYIEGQINRPGTFSLPPNGITLSRLVASAGGLGQLAIPERVDLIRMVGDNREAAIRLNLGAIRHRTEPDVLLKPDDHIIIGTSWIATPLAVIRNGFRATYGFGLLLDRNFGNDVFGVPPGFTR